jgi:hypothetical protein
MSSPALTDVTILPPAGRYGMLAHWLAALVPLTWLLPQHYLPWLTAHQDFWSFALLCLAGLASGAAALPRAWAAAIALALISAAAQPLFLPVYAGDAVMVALYLAGFGGAIAIGGWLARQPQVIGAWHALDLLAAGTIGACVVSVAAALMQWTDTDALPITVAAMLPGDRPYANFAQANHFSTSCFLGLVALCWLRERAHLGTRVWLLGAAWMCVGLVLSGSRTAWLQWTVTLIALAWAQWRGFAGHLRLKQLLPVAGFFVGLSLAWPAINAVVVTGPGLAGRAALDVAGRELRWPLWQAMFDAISRQPLLGYGWNRVQAAQFDVALEHGSIQRYFEFSHNLLIDLMVWVGVPLALVLMLLAGRALMRQLRAIDDARTLWLAVGVTSVLVHAMLEFPLGYAYFLLPFGMAIGALHGLRPAQRDAVAPVAVGRAGWLVLTAALAVIAVDYLRVEENYRTVRLESTFNSRRIETPAPDLVVLGQLGDLLRFVRTEARPQMSEAELDAFRHTARRFGHPPVLLRLALAEGLNGKPEAAGKTLRRLCAMHTPPFCEEGRQAWRHAQNRWPGLAAVAFP